METLPATSGQPENVPAWSAREELPGTGREAALSLGHWDQALELSAAVVTSVHGRDAPQPEIARSRFSDYGPMITHGVIPRDC